MQCLQIWLQHRHRASLVVLVLVPMERRGRSRRMLLVLLLLVLLLLMLLVLQLLLLRVGLGVQEGREQLHGQRKDDGRVLLGGNAAQGLQVSQLKETRFKQEVIFPVPGEPQLTCRADGLAEMISEASRRALDDFISPSAAITFARASLAASASAAIARWRAVGNETSLLQVDHG